jgi:hypothetical protein
MGALRCQFLQLNNLRLQASSSSCIVKYTLLGFLVTSINLELSVVSVHNHLCRTPNDHVIRSSSLSSSCRDACCGDSSVGSSTGSSSCSSLNYRCEWISCTTDLCTNRFVMILTHEIPCCSHKLCGAGVIIPVIEVLTCSCKISASINYHLITS